MFHCRGLQNISLTKLGISDLKKIQNVRPFPLDVTNLQSVEKFYDFVKQNEPEGFNMDFVQTNFRVVGSYK
jgi:hypothetical protein